jgi:hypothetical protein
VCQEGLTETAGGQPVFLGPRAACRLQQLKLEELHAV